jgi:Outer membrane protein beta-barrel domain
MARHRSMAGALSLLLAFLFLILTVPASAQQDYVGKFDVYGGFTWMSSASANLYQRGGMTQVAYNWNRWLALGADYSNMTGNTSIIVPYLKTSLQEQLNAQITAAGGLPPGYTLYVPYHGDTWTFAAGPAFNFRKFKHVTLFIHPNLGLIHEKATTKPVDLIQKLIVTQLAPSGKKEDTVMFYGLGGGMDLNATKHVGIRMTVDYVHCDLFSDLLKDPRNSWRLGVGPTFHFGKDTK